MFVYLQKLLHCLIIYSYNTNPSFLSCPWNLRSIRPSDCKVISIETTVYHCLCKKKKTLRNGLRILKKENLNINLHKTQSFDDTFFSRIIMVLINYLSGQFESWSLTAAGKVTVSKVRQIFLGRYDSWHRQSYRQYTIANAFYFEVHFASTKDFCQILLTLTDDQIIPVQDQTLSNCSKSVLN